MPYERNNGLTRHHVANVCSGVFVCYVISESEVSVFSDTTSTYPQSDIWPKRVEEPEMSFADYCRVEIC